MPLAAWPYSNVNSVWGSATGPGPLSMTVDTDDGDLLVLFSNAQGFTPSLSLTLFAENGATTNETQPTKVWWRRSNGSDGTIVLSSITGNTSDFVWACFDRGNFGSDPAYTSSSTAGAVTPTGHANTLITVVTANATGAAAVDSSSNPNDYEINGFAAAVYSDSVSVVARRGSGVSTGATYTQTSGSIMHTISFYLSLPYPGRTIRRIDFT